jgi:hypothetical protein
MKREERWRSLSATEKLTRGRAALAGVIRERSLYPSEPRIGLLELGTEPTLHLRSYGGSKDGAIGAWDWVGQRCTPPGR